MYSQSIPEEAQQVLLEDAMIRDRATARRVNLFRLLWAERYLTRDQLVTRLEGLLGRECFGEKAWEDTFYRDMRVVKIAFQLAGYSLKFSRSKQQPGYYLMDQPPLARELTQALEGSIREVDGAQIAIIRSLTPAERYRQGCMISENARRVVMYRIQNRRPELTSTEVSLLATKQVQGKP